MLHKQVREFRALNLSRMLPMLPQYQEAREAHAGKRHSSGEHLRQNVAINSMNFMSD